MIGCVFGHIGAGKSYHAIATFIIPSLKAGMTVVTNLAGLDPVALSAIWKLDTSKLILITDEQIIGFWRIAADKDRLIFVLDEIQNFYGSSNYRQNKDSREELKIFMTKCRHDGHSIVYICQVPEMVHTDILRLTETFIQCAKLNFIKFFPSTRYTWIARKSYKTKNSAVLEQGIVRYDPKVYVCYQSTKPGVEETKTKFDKMGYVPWKIVVPIILVIVLWVFSRIWFGSSSKSAASVPSGSGVFSSSSVPKVIRIDTVNGWYSDGKTVSWMRNGNVVLVTPDSGRRSSVVYDNGIRRVVCQTSTLAFDVSTGFDDGLERKDNGASTSGVSPAGSSLPSGSVQ